MSRKLIRVCLALLVLSRAPKLQIHGKTGPTKEAKHCKIDIRYARAWASSYCENKNVYQTHIKLTLLADKACTISSTFILRYYASHDGQAEALFGNSFNADATNRLEVNSFSPGHRLAGTAAASFIVIMRSCAYVRRQLTLPQKHKNVWIFIIVYAGTI